MPAALVTGSGARLGKAMALYLASRGYDVGVHYASSSAGAAAVVADIQAMGRHAVALQADLLDETATQGLIAKATAELESNLRAPFVLTQNFAMQAPDPIDDSVGEPVAQALVLNMLDQRVHKLTPEFMSYTIAKMGLWAMTRTAAQALAPKVRVNGIGPGPKGAGQTEDQFARQRAATTLQRGVNPDDICAALGYFLDAKVVTGQMLCVDGGQHLGWETPDVTGVE